MKNRETSQMLKFGWIGLTFCLATAASTGYGLDLPGRIYADPVGSAMLDNTFTLTDLDLVMNNTEDRVGVRAKMCDSFSDLPCNRIYFNFPQLRLDKEKNLVMLGDTPVATYRPHGMRVTVNKDYHLGYEVTSKTMDSGFKKSVGRYMQVYLEPKAANQQSK